MTLILPPSAAVPANPTPGYAQNGSGLYVPSFEVPNAGALTIAKPEDIDHVGDILAQQKADLTAKYGAPAADALMGASEQIAASAAREIEHDRIVEAFLSGNLAAAIAAASHVQP